MTLLPLLVSLVTFATLFSPILAQNATDTVKDTTESGINYVLSAQAGVLGAILIALGLLFLFFGIRMFKIVCFLAGFYVGGAIAYIILANVEPASGYANRETVFLCVCLAAGLLVGFLFMCIWRLGLAAIGALGGFFLALFILSCKSDGVIQSGIGRAIFIAIFCILGAILISFFEKPILILSTSIAGSFSFIYGVDIFAHKGFIQAVRVFLGERSLSATYELTGVVIGMLVSVLILAGIGMVVQYRLSKNHEHRKK